jgi:hypothetical protein
MGWENTKIVIIEFIEFLFVSLHLVHLAQYTEERRAPVNSEISFQVS